MMTFLKVEEDALNGTKTEEKRLAEDVENRVVEDVEAVERALQEVAEESVREVAAVEQALKEEVDIVNPWGRPAIVYAAGDERGSFHSSEGVEPVSIYYSNAPTHRQSPLLVALTAAAALLLAPGMQ